MTVTESVARPSTSRAPGRPAATPTEAEAANLHRVADLAVAILNCLRKDGRSRYDRQAQLQGWLTDAGVQFSSSDINPALSLCEASGLLVRPATGLGQPRPGWLPTVADAVPELPEPIRLGRVVVSVTRPGNGRGRWATREEIAQRLLDADEEISDEQLTGILRRLVDCKQLQMVRQIAYGPVSLRRRFGLGLRRGGQLGGRYLPGAS